MKLQPVRIADALGHALDREGFVFGVWAAVRLWTPRDVEPEWSVTHVPSGMRLAEPRERDAAVRRARHLGAVLPTWCASRAFGDATPIGDEDADALRRALQGAS